MTRSKCERCLFGGLCEEPWGCEFFSPIDEEESAFNRFVRHDRKDFMEQWEELREYEFDLDSFF